MGNRVSISFKNGDEESVVLFSQWRGLGLVEQARDYAQALVDERRGSEGPLDRLEPSTVMVDFIRELTWHWARVAGRADVRCRGGCWDGRGRTW